MKITLKNDKHGTEYTLETNTGWIGREVVAECRATLCPEPGCTCSRSLLGMAGPQDTIAGYELCPVSTREGLTKIYFAQIGSWPFDRGV